MLKPTIALLFCLVFFTCLTAQNYAFKNYTTHDGLVQTDITDITQDKKGNIWIGTNGGISIFDGKNFTNYDDHDILQSLHINSFLCDSNGIMWIATGNGLLRYEKNFEVFFKSTGAQNTAVTCLTANSQHELLFVCNNTIYQVKNNKAEKYTINNNIDGKVDLVAFDRDDNLWIITTTMNIYRKTENIITTIRSPLHNAMNKEGFGFLKLLGTESINPYFVSNFGSYWVKDDSLMTFAEQYPQFSNTKIGVATYVLQGDDSTVWVGGTVGLSKIVGQRSTRFAKSNGFCDNSVSCIFTDKENNVWIGCTYNGVYKLSNEALFHLKPSNEAFDLRHISDITPLSPNKTLMSTWGKGLYLLQGDSVSRIEFPYPIIRYITCLFPMGSHTYIGWFGQGLWKMNNETFRMTPVPGFSRDEAIKYIFKTGGNLVIETLGRTLYLTDLEFNIKVSIMLGENYSISVLKDKIYAMTDVGQVDVLDNNLKVVKRNIFPDITSAITEITCYRDNFLIGTFGQGLFVYNQFGKLIKRIDKRNGLNTNIITSLLVDGMHLFIGTNLGLIRAELPELQNIKIFKESEGMFNWECRKNGLKKLANGAIMVATTNGPYIYYPTNDRSGQFTSATLSIADFIYGSGKKNMDISGQGSNIQLQNAIDYKDNQITVTLKGVSQRNPDDIIYHYQLQGYDSMWIATSNPVITFDDIDPGDYKLRAYITVGNFTSKPVSIKFSVNKPLSGKLWFQALLVLFLSGLCWLLLTAGNRIYQKYIQSKMVSRMETDIALKRELTSNSILTARLNYQELNESLKGDLNSPQNTELVKVFLTDICKRIEWLWKKDEITIREFHDYFNELIAEYVGGSTVYHKTGAEDNQMAMTTAFQLLQVFSLYLISSLRENPAAVFSLDSENKSNGHVLIRFYTVTHTTSFTKNNLYHFLKEAIEKQKANGVTIDVIENLEFGNMIIAELNLHNEKSI